MSSSLADGRDVLELAIWGPPDHPLMTWAAYSAGPYPQVTERPLARPTFGAERWRGRMVMRIGPFDLAAARSARFVFLAVEPKRRDEFDRWYGTEHLPNLAAVPGTIAAARFLGTGDLPPHLAVYQVDSLDVCRTDAWVRAGDTQWAAGVRQHIVRRRRFEFDSYAIKQREESACDDNRG